MLQLIILCVAALLLISGCWKSDKTEKSSDAIESINLGGLLNGNATIINGAGVLRNKDVNSLVINGTAQLDTVTSHKIQVNGSITAQKLKAQNMNVNGKALLQDSSISETTRVNGLLETDKTELGNVYLSTDFAKFTESQVKNISVKAPEKKSKQVIELIDTTVSGSITFEQLEGEVRASGKSKIIGNVTGGKIVNLKS